MVFRLSSKLKRKTVDILQSQLNANFDVQYDEENNDIKIVAVTDEDTNLFQSIANKVNQSDLQQHESSTTNVHGISDTSLLATTSYVDQAEIDAINSATSSSVSKVDGSVTTASSSSNVVRNITISTSDPIGGLDGDIWIKYTV